MKQCWKEQYDGDYSSESDFWKQGTDEYNLKENEFYMPLKKFMFYFEAINVCKVANKNVYSSIDVNFPI